MKKRMLQIAVLGILLATLIVVFYSKSRVINNTDVSEDEILTQYLQENTRSAGEENLSDLFSLIDTEKYDIFANGEFHGTRNVGIFEIELLKYLHQNAGVRYFIIECGFGAGQYLNLYLNSGNEEYLQGYMAGTKGSYGYCKEEAELFRSIYEYNQMLPKDERITVIGIDTDNMWTVATEYLAYLCEENHAPEEMKEIIGVMKEDDATNGDNYLKILQHYEDNQESYEEFLGEKYTEYNFIMDNLKATVEFFNLSGNLDDAYSIRERQIYNNFKACYPYLAEGKIMIHFGGWHVSQEKQMGENWGGSFLARAIADNILEKDKVCSLILIPSNCELMDVTGGEKPTPTIPSCSGLIGSVDKSIIASVTEDYGLVKLDGENSPFMTKEDYMINGAAGCVITDCYQYVYVLKNSPACELYEE